VALVTGHGDEEQKPNLKAKRGLAPPACPSTSAARSACAWRRQSPTAPTIWSTLSSRSAADYRHSRSVRPPLGIPVDPDDRDRGRRQGVRHRRVRDGQVSARSYGQRAPRRGRPVGRRFLFSLGLRSDGRGVYWPFCLPCPTSRGRGRPGTEWSSPTPGCLLYGPAIGQFLWTITTPGPPKIPRDRQWTGVQCALRGRGARSVVFAEVRRQALDRVRVRGPRGHV